MTEAIKNFLLETVGKEWCVFFCAMLPIIELRGAIPLGAVLGMPWWQSFLLGVAGNMVPVPLILIFITKVIEWMSRSKIRAFCKFANWLNRKAEKNREKIERYSFWGVCLFVAIPLPATGAWTGSLVASTIEMRFWKALLSTFIGVLIAGTIMTLGSYSIVSIFSIFK